MKSGRTSLTPMKFSAPAALLLALGAIPFSAVTAESQAPLTVPLEYREVSSPFVTISGNVSERSTPFANEPQAKSSAVRRGTVTFPTFKTSTATNAPLPFVCNFTEGKLVLDLNRNGNLTDDPTGVFTAARRVESGDAYQQCTFTNVHFIGDDPLAPWFVNLYFLEYRGSLDVYAEVRSYWSGKATLDGQEWEFGIVSPGAGPPELNAALSLLVRPWGKRDSSFSSQDDSLDVIRMPGRLFFADRTFQPQAAPNSGERSPLALKLSEQPQPVGRVNFVGQFIERVVLTSQSGTTVLLDHPGQGVRVPAGIYTDVRVRISNGTQVASSARSSGRTLKVADGQTVDFPAGGPLSNTVTTSLSGGFIDLNYRLRGAGGDFYTLIPPNTSEPPQFAVYEGTRKVDSGKFAFG